MNSAGLKMSLTAFFALGFCRLSLAQAEEGTIYSDLDEASLTDPQQLSFEEEPASVKEVTEGSPLKLSCSVTAIPPATITWLRNGVPVSGEESRGRNEAEKLSNFGRKTVQMATTKSELNVDCVDRRSVGSYSCVGDNGYQKIRANTTVTLQESNVLHPALCRQKKRGAKTYKSWYLALSPARITEWTDIRMELTGSSAQLFCRSEGFPAPEVTWFLFQDAEDDENMGAKTRVVNDENHLLLGNGDLLVRSSAGNSGALYYECQVKNSLSEDAKIIMLVNMD